MADNNKVTIDADYFAELYRKQFELELLKKSNDNRVKERDELKAKLEDAKRHYCTSATGNKAGDSCVVAKRCQELEAANEDLKSKVVSPEIKKHYEKLENEFICVSKRLADAERCIEDCFNLCNKEWNATAEIANIIRTYREKKEAK